ncbi:Wall-associated receptor kinase-like 9 [Morella rubra]|uniref:Wall-associated receptor kinase-like 9 n=1 Tax=Morella rubra TaxID=262757 RepID=A0A6A1WBX6_9ROSI|nr:Wall-associated receptor kinase-like 9 [Morella rubra]
MVPVRCACPTLNQTMRGVTSLVAYMLSDDSIFASTPVLVPLNGKTCTGNSDSFFCNCPGRYLTDGGKCMLDGVGIGMGFLCLFLSGYMLYRYQKKRRHRIRKEKLFKQNGGFLLQERFSSYGSSEKAKIFTTEELQRATDSYNRSRYLGQGVYGTVYKGMLSDGSIVADPEYFQSSQFTEKSDVYSFGVVLVELLTGEKPISFARDEEDRNLVAYFITLAREDRLHQILDPRVAREARREDIDAMAKLIMKCLRLNGKKRPMMKEVYMELEALRKSQNCLEICPESHSFADEELIISTADETKEYFEESKTFSIETPSISI